MIAELPLSRSSSQNARKFSESGIFFLCEVTRLFYLYINVFLKELCGSLENNPESHSITLKEGRLS